MSYRTPGGDPDPQLTQSPTPTGPEGGGEDRSGGGDILRRGAESGGTNGGATLFPSAVGF